MNDFIRSLEAEDVIIFDSFGLLSADDGYGHPAYYRDELHLSVRGYSILNHHLEPLLQTLTD